VKLRCLAVLLVLGACGVLAHPAQAQAGIYGEFSATKMNNGVTSPNWLYGATVGVLADGPRFLHNRLQLGGDVQGRFVNKDGFNYNGMAIGPRIYVPMRSFRPYGEFMFGFARLKNAVDASTGTTDGNFQLNVGVAKKLRPHWDVTAEYSYSQYFANNGEYNPKTVSAGVVYYFAKR